MPFTAAAKKGFTDFFLKYLPAYKMPDVCTLSNTSLNDMYSAGLVTVKQFLADIHAVCVMFDSWTDKYKARSYVAVRVSVIKNWKQHVITLNCDVLPSHTAEALSQHVTDILKQFFPDVAKLFLTTCHDGAANCMKTSRLLKSQYVQHCIAHVLHLLLTTDSMSQIPDLLTLLQKCRSIVTTLHYKGSMIDDELSNAADKQMLECMVEVVEAIELEDQFPVEAQVEDVHGETDTDSDIAQSIMAVEYRGNHTLKQFVSTRWNSSLIMIRSILDLETQVQTVLRKTGHRELCLHESELSLLRELRTFLEPFEAMTHISSTSGIILSFVPLMKCKIRRLCGDTAQDDTAIRLSKKKILKNLDRRLPESDFIKMYQILDPDTRASVTPTEAVAVCTKSFSKLKSAGFITDFSASQSRKRTIDATSGILLFAS